MRRRWCFVSFCAVISVCFCACGDEGPAVRPRVPVGLLWGSGASGAFIEDTIPLVALYRDSAGDPIGWNDPLVTWSSSNPYVIEILSDSIAVARDSGVAVLTATAAHTTSDTLQVGFEVIRRWSGTLAWDRSPTDGANSGIAVLEFPGHEVRQLPELGYPGAGSGAPYLSSDGRFLAAIARRASGTRRTIYVIDLVTDIKSAPFDSLPGNQVNPVWFPGDTLLAFLMEAPSGYEVFTARPDGTGRVQRTLLGQQRPPFFDLTPEGNLIIELRTGTDSADAFETTLSGTIVRRLTTTPEDEISLSVSPDGTMIAYVVGQHVWLRDRDGSNPRRLLPNRRTMMGYAPNLHNAASTTPSWTQDSRYVVVSWLLDTFVNTSGEAYEVLGEIYAIRVADGLAIRLSRSALVDVDGFFR